MLLCVSSTSAHDTQTSPNVRRSFFQRSMSSFSFLVDDVVEALPADVQQFVQTTPFYSSFEQAEQERVRQEQLKALEPSATEKRLTRVMSTPTASASESKHMVVFADNTTTTSTLTPEQRAMVSARYSTASKALKLRDQSPRFRAPASGKEFKPTDTDYIISVAIYLGIGVGCAVLALIFTFFVYFFYCCWHCCCRDKNKPHTVYLGASRWVPYAFGIIFGILFCAFCIVGLLANSSLSGRFSKSSSSSLGNTSDRVITTIADYLTSISNKLLDIVNETPGVGASVSNIVGSISGLETGTTKLNSDLNTFSTTYNSSYKVNIPTSSYGAAAMVYNCTGCGGFSTVVTNAVSYITSSVQPQFDTYRKTTQDVQDSFVKVSDQIVEQGNKAKNTVDNAQNKVVGNDTRSKLRDFWDNADKYETYRWDAMTIVFCLPFGIFLCLLGGGGLKSRKLFYFSCCSGWFLVLLLFILFGVHWFLGALLGDACATADEYVVDIDGKLSGDAAVVVNSCLVNTSVLVGLGYDRQLNFSDVIKFPTPPDVNQLFNIPGFDTLVSGVNSATIYTMFDFSVNSIPNSLSALNAITKLDGNTGSYTKANVRTTYSSSLYDNTGASPTKREQADSRFALVDQYLTSETKVTDALTAMQSNITSISNYKSQLQANFSNTVSAIGNARGILDPLIRQVNLLKDMAYCQFLVDAFFYDMKGVVCNDVTYDISNLAMALFFISFSLWFVVWISRSMAHRIREPQVMPAQEEWKDNTAEWLAKSGQPNAYGDGAAAVGQAEMVATGTNQQWMTNEQGQWVSSQHNTNGGYDMTQQQAPPAFEQPPIYEAAVAPPEEEIQPHYAASPPVDDPVAAAASLDTSTEVEKPHTLDQLMSEHADNSIETTPLVAAEADKAPEQEE